MTRTIGSVPERRTSAQVVPFAILTPSVRSAEKPGKPASTAAITSSGRSVWMRLLMKWYGGNSSTSAESGRPASASIPIIIAAVMPPSRQNWWSG